MRPRLRLALFAAVALLTVGVAPPARAADPGLFRSILGQIEAGTFNPCDYTPKKLQTALDSIPPDFDEYAPEIRPALEDAINNYHCPKQKPKGAGTGSAHAGGGSAGGGGAGPTPSSGTAVPSATAHPGHAAGHEKVKPTPGGSVSATQAPAPIARTPVDAAPLGAVTGEGSRTPAVLLVLAVLGGLGALGALLVTASRGLGWEPRWAPGMRHAWAEAGHRSGGVWGDFRDWLRLGR